MRLHRFTGTALIAAAALVGSVTPAAAAGSDDARVLYGCLSGPRTEVDGSGSGPSPLCSVRADGTDRRVLTPRDHFHTDDNAAWSPDGRKFAYVADTSTGRAVVVADADGTNRRVVAEGDYRELAWSPDGTALAVTSYGEPLGRGLWMLDLAAGSQRRLHDGWHSRVSWSPDGSQLAFGIIDDSDPEAPRVELGVMPSRGGPVRMLGRQASSTKTSWSPDGRWLLQGFTLISPVDGSAKVLRTLPEDTFATTTWSPDGSQIAYLMTSQRDSPSESIGVLRADGSDLRTLVRLDTLPFLPPEWLPDGSGLLYAHTRQDPDVETRYIDGDLFRVALDGSAPQQLTDGDTAEAPDLPSLVTRAAGATRIDTAVSTSRTTFPSAPAVVLARADLFPDALSAAPLAAKLDAPLLLSATAGAAPAVLAEVRRLGATTAYLIGDETALSAEVERQLRTAGITTVRRLGGDTRYDTAAAIAREVGGSEVYLASGQDFPDAAAVSALAGFQQRPVVLTTRDALPEASSQVLAELDVTTVGIIGGATVISEQVADAAAEGRTVVRLAGPDRYATSARIAEASLAAGMTAARPWLSTGRAFPDALSAGPAAARTASVLLLVDPATLDASPATRDWLRQHRSSYTDLMAVGGPDVVSPVVTTAALR